MDLHAVFKTDLAFHVLILIITDLKTSKCNSLTSVSVSSVFCDHSSFQGFIQRTDMTMHMFDDEDDFSLTQEVEKIENMYSAQLFELPNYEDFQLCGKVEEEQDDLLLTQVCAKVEDAFTDSQIIELISEKEEKNEEASFRNMSRGDLDGSGVTQSSRACPPSKPGKCAFFSIHLLTLS